LVFLVGCEEGFLVSEQSGILVLATVEAARRGLNGVLDGLRVTGLQDGLFELLLTFHLIFVLLLICEPSK